LVHQLRKSYSLTDLGNDESDFGGAELRAITNDTGKTSIFLSARSASSVLRNDF